VPPTALALILASAATHATWNALLKRSRDTAAAAAVLVALAASLSAAIAVATGTAHLPRLAIPWAFASAAVEAVYFATLAAAMARLPLGTAYGVARGGGQLLTWPLSILLLGEAVSLTSVIGAALITVGLLSTARGGGRGLLWAVACACAIGLYPLTYKRALAEGAPEAALFAVSLCFSLPLQIVLLGRTRWTRLADTLRTDGRALGFGAVLCAVSFLSFLAALEIDGAGRASALRNTSVLFALIAARILGERPTARAIGGAVLIAVGAVLVVG
jgi:drug/metabolite transporter (DMT)-like permease